MRKLLVGTSVAALSFINPFNQAGSQTKAECAPIYDETTEGDSTSQLLRQQISDFAMRGVEVHVQIYEDATDNGLTGEANVDGYAEKLADDCNFGDNLVNILISKNPRVYDIDRDGTAEYDISQSKSDDIADQLVEDLRDTSTSYQDDAANVLRRLSVREDSGEPSNNPQNEKTQSNEDDLNIPFKEIGLAFALASGLTASGARVVRGQTIRKSVRRALRQATEAGGEKVGAVTDADKELSVLADDDAQGLRVLISGLDQQYFEITEESNKLSALSKSERRRVWPNKHLVTQQVDTVRSLTNKLSNNVDITREKTTELSEFIQNIDELISKFDAELASYNASIDTLFHNGWEITPLQNSLETFMDIQATVHDQKSKGYVEKPAELMDEFDGNIIEATRDAESFPNRRAELDGVITEKAEYFLVLKDQAESAKTVLAELRNSYHESCVEDLKDFESDLSVQITELESWLIGLQQNLGIKSVDIVQNSEKSIESLNQIISRLESTISLVPKRQQLLDDLKSELPEDVASSEAKIVALGEFIEKYFDDIEPENSHKISELRQIMAEFKSNYQIEGKPKYLELSAQINKLESRIDKAQEKAAEDKSEMDELRGDVTSLERNVRSDLERLTHYIGGHRSDISSSIEQSAAGITLLKANTRDSRRGLRSQVSGYQDTISIIEDIEQHAKQAVRAAENRREDERRQRQRDEDERRRRSSSSSSGFSGSFGSGSSGGGGDSSRSSGSW